MALTLAAGAVAWWISATQVEGSPRPSAPTVIAAKTLATPPEPDAVVRPQGLSIVGDAGDAAADLVEASPVDAGGQPEAPVSPTVPKPAAIDAGFRTLPPPATSTVELKAVPYATVTVDGRLVGEVEGSRTIRLTVGTHELIFTHPRQTRKERVVVKAGQTASVLFDARTKQ